MKSKLRPRCYFDIDIGHSPAGRIIFELYDDLCPKTTDNFIKLCTGDIGIGETTKKKLHYLNSTFHRVIKGFMIQGGDFSNGDGTGGESIYGGKFADENLETPHDKPFLLSMANCGPNTNGSQFFITTKPASHLDGKHVVFGHVVSGENLIESIENLPVNSMHKPVVDATISNCGELIPIRKKKTKKQKEKEASVDSSSSKGKKKKKSKKKKHRNKKKTKNIKDEESQEFYPKCSVRPDEIPEVPKPYFLYRGNLKEEQDKVDLKEEKEVTESSQYPSKDIIGRSGRVIKGRGQLRYYSKSPRDRLETPPHWKKETHKSENNNKSDENTNRLKRRRSPSTNSNKDYQRYRRSQREKSNDRPHVNARDNYDSTAREKRKKYDVWKDVPHNDDKSRRHKARDDLKDYGDIEMIDNSQTKPNQRENMKKRSVSLENNKQVDNEKPAHSTNYKSSKPKVEKVGTFESNTIIFPYADESDDSLKHKRSEKIVDPKSRIVASSDQKDKNDDKSDRNDHENVKKDDRLPIVRKRSSSSDNIKIKSKSPVDTKKHTHSPPAHLVAKWRNRRDKIMTRRSPMSRSKDRNHSRSRHSPRKYSPRYSRSPNSDLISIEHKTRDVSDKVGKMSRNISKDDKSSSGTMDSSPSSAGSSVSNRPCRIDSELSDTEKTVNTQCWVNDSTENQNVDAQKDKKTDSALNNMDKMKEHVEAKIIEDSIEKETVMILKTPDKPWLTSQWKAEEEEANKRNSKNNVANSVLAKLREDDQKKKSQEKIEKPTVAPVDKKIPSPVSQSISKYRSPSGTKSSDNARSSYSSSSSSKSYSRRRSTRRRSRSRSRSRSGYRRRYRNSRYRRSSRRSTSRSVRRYRSRSRSYSRSPRRRYSSRSSSTSTSSRYRRSSRRNYRGLGFRRPSVSPRPRK